MCDVMDQTVSQHPMGGACATDKYLYELSLTPLPLFPLPRSGVSLLSHPTPPLSPSKQFAAPGFVLKSFLKGQREMVSRWETGGGEWRASEKGATPRERALLRHGCRTSRAATFDPDTKIGRVICDLCNISRFGILTPAFQTRI